MDDKVSAVQIEVDGLERVQAMLDELNGHLRAAQSAIDSLGAVELDVRAVTVSDGAPARS